MRKAAVSVGKKYVAKVSGRLVVVRLDSESRYGGWDATNMVTRRTVRIKTAAKLRREVKPDTKALEQAAAKILLNHGRPRGRMENLTCPSGRKGAGGR